MKIAANKYILAFLSPVLLWLSWEPIGIAWLMLVALIPLIHFHVASPLRGWRYFIALYSHFLVFNILVTWWVWNSTPWGAVTMLILNSLFMCFPWLLARHIGRLLGHIKGLLALVVLWLAFENLHLRWDLSWPWLNLGNAFAAIPSFVQWYEFTGVAGGTLLVFATNLSFYFALVYTSKKRVAYTALGVVALYLISFIIGTYRGSQMQQGTGIQTAVLQPNYDPWTEKFDLDPMYMLTDMIQLSNTAVTDSTQMLLWPETSLVDNIDITNPYTDYQIARLTAWCRSKPNLNIYTGADGIKIYTQTSAKPERAARPYGSDKSTWMVFYNTSFAINADSVVPYHKSKLVPGTEILPFTQFLPFLENLAVGLDENSATGTLGTSNHSKPMQAGKLSYVPAICYESIYGDHIRRFVANGAQFINIITNDAWWGNSPGYKQHFSFARLRAIETRKWVARSANTGISGFVNPIGQVVKSSEYNQKTVLTATIYPNNTRTLYTLLGDYIGLLASIVAALLLLYVLLRRFIKF